MAYWTDDRELDMQQRRLDAEQARAKRKMEQNAMTKLITQIDYTLELAQGAYSEDRYTSWRQVAKLLLAKGYEPKEAAAIMRSKWTRWAADSYEKTYGKCPATAIIKFIDDPKNRCTSAAVKELVDQTF